MFVVVCPDDLINKTKHTRVNEAAVVLAPEVVFVCRRDIPASERSADD